MGHFERDGDAWHVSAAPSAGADEGMCQCSGVDAHPGRFNEATSFNQSISVWDTSGVTTMYRM